MQISKRNSLLLVISMMALASCSEAPSITSDKKVTVTFVDNDSVSFSSQVYKIDKGTDLKAKIRVKEGYYFKDCSYPSYQFTTSENEIDLTLENVRYNVRVSLDTPLLGGVIYYFLNGGTFNDPTRTGDSYSLPFEESAYRRPNLDIGTPTISREGYELTGWNTMPDGTGVHIGLGSRATIEKTRPGFFYAEWVKDNELSDFEYEIKDDYISLKKYNGEPSGDKLVIPSLIDGKQVREISAYFAKDLDFNTLYLPPFMTTIGNRAFISSTFDEVYLFDNLIDAKDMSFSNNLIKTWHINAIQYPKYGIGGLIGELPDDFDRLIANSDKKRIVLAGGCSLSYGIKTPTLQKYFDDYTIINTGVIGEIGPIPVFGALSHYLKSGDLLIHTPEQASENEFLHSLKAEARTYACFRQNYDLLSYCDMSKMSFTFDAFSASNKSNVDYEEDRGGYECTNPEYNEYGEISKERPGLNNDVGFSDGEYTYQLSYISDETGERLRREYKMIEDSGADVVFSHAPLNKSNLTKDDLNNEIWKEFESRCKAQFDPYGYNVISKVEDYLYNGRYFYDEDYHLTDIGAEMRSEKLAKDILTYLGR